MTHLSRRSVLALPVLAATAVGVGGVLAGSDPAVAGAPEILKPLPPTWFIDHGSNAEMRWGSVDPRRHLTSPDRLFVRNHTATPRIDPATYALNVYGDGLRDSAGSALSLDQLRALGEVQVTSVHECTGNGRSFFTGQQGESVSGTAWGLGAVGAVRWTGVRLRDVLAAVGLRSDAVSVMATGLDDDYVSDRVNYGPVRRPFPIGKALDDALLAWGMNGVPLPPDHGFPLRLVLPGWVGIGSIKWLGSLEVSASELTSPWNTLWYTLDGEPLAASPVRSAWELDQSARIPSTERLRLTGRSWSGAAPIARVEVSTDGGGTWTPAKLARPGRSGAGRRRGWTQWSHTWRYPARGSHVLLARATDMLGRTQPQVARFNPNGYFFDAVVRHPVQVV